MASSKPAGIMFRSCGPCRGTGHLEIRITCPVCQGQGTQDLPLHKAVKDLLEQYGAFLDGEDGALDGLRDRLTDLKEAAGL